jgi:hypothetical protein
MRRSAVCATAVAVSAVSIATGWSVNAGAQLLEGGEVQLPGGGGVQLPGGDNTGIGVDLPGELDGDGVQLGGDGSGGGGSSTPLPEPSAPAPTEPAPAPEPTAPAPAPSGGGETGTDTSTDTGVVDDVSGGGGRDGVRGDEERERDRASGGTPAGHDPMEPAPIRRPDGAPTSSNPGLTVAGFGPAPVGVPNFVIDSFSIPPFLLPIYQSCGTQYGIPWQVLASINRIETAFGTNLNVSTAGALGWMQFMPATWEGYGVDANNDGRKDPYNPVDAICAAANYLNASGYGEDARGAIFAYNHADWYVDEVLLYANQYGKLPSDLVGSLTGLTEGARFPVAANARYADDIAERRALERSKPGKGVLTGNAAEVIESSPTRRGINIFTREEAPVVAVNDGVVTEIGKSKKLGRYLVLRDNYGNRYTYAQLGELQEAYPVPAERKGARRTEAELAHDEATDATAAKSGRRTPTRHDAAAGKQRIDAQGEGVPQAVNTEDARPRLFAYPERQGLSALEQPIDPTERFLERVGYESFRSYFGVRRFNPKRTELRQLREGSRVVGGTVLGRVGDGGDLAPHVHFSIQPAGRGAPTIDPKPILDGWKLLEATHIYRATGKNPFANDSASSGQVLLLSKEQAIRQLLAEPRVEIYECGRQDIQTGQIDVRVMKLLLYLARSGFRTGVTSLKCGHSVYTSSGNISHHSIGGAVDIATINGLPVLGNQGAGSITEALIRHILELQGTMVPDQVISLMDMGGPTFVMGDHADHVHVGYSGATTGASGAEPQMEALLKAEQWERLISRLGEIENPEVPTKPSRYSLKVKRDRGDNGRGGRGSPAHIGE